MISTPFSRPDQISEAIRQLAVWPLRIVQVRALFADAWRLRKNLTFADATYVALAERLGAKLLTDDHKLATLRRCLCRSVDYDRPVKGPGVEDNPGPQRTPALRLTDGLHGVQV